MPFHTVKQGECLSSIAERYGFADYHTIWNHPENADLKRRRPDPNILFPTDRLFVPEKTMREEPAQSGKRHGFVLRRSKVQLDLVLQFDGEPLANKNYSLTVGLRQHKGTTDEQGKLTEPIKVGVETAVLRLDDPVVEWELRIGHLDPTTEVSGVQGRLNNLGHPCGKVDGVVGARTRAALRQFQSRHGLKPTGAIDAATSNALRKAHDQS
jgi:N-acetylmuramoyl-L-alanine amidase